MRIQRSMKTWNVMGEDVEPHRPRILSTSGDARAIALHLPAGEELQEHEVHERAFLVVLDGEVEVSADDGAAASASAGALCEFDPQERHTVRATRDARLLLLLTPWPGDGHPGAMSLEAKGSAREDAAARNA
jgi:quercetin dioxygenase-like cupin family protein